jgi:hypothetical protein
MGFTSDIYKYDTPTYDGYRVVNIHHRNYTNACELSVNFMIRDIQQWLDENPVSYKVTPEYHKGKFHRLVVVIE